ncbi:DUF4034 domain-containing protein [Plantactinospora sp. S1510]|uniref:DUF4034 domain-containing protein n=1 Tax=Plantactinospora alkalitolerans TaxID=2789879 RepID=A0ABS0H331_9ACTN|nr:DUF4034 domain-containing protein [Plantactinospora alkalitolerans]MBF9132873.1 DUF4034 domain-containing protein [Plantactinospora alkalitolerans]
MWPFRKRRERPTPTPGLVIDPAYGDPQARALINALSIQDWRTARDILTAETDPDTRAFLMEAVGKVDDVQDWIGEWVGAEPDSTLPMLVQGCHAVHWAWEARGGKRAEYTGQDQFREFFRRLRIAENLLDDVVARDPDDVTAWTWLVTSSRGRQVDADEARRRFDEVVKRHPGHVVAHEQRLQYLCAKWFGSEEQMFSFAREATAAAPDGSVLPELLAVAHIEKWLEMPGEESDAYMQSGEVRADLLTAAEKSIFHPAFRRPSGWVPRVSTFALALELAHEFEAAARVFELLGDNVSEWPWLYVREPVAAFVTSREWVYENLS